VGVKKRRILRIFFLEILSEKPLDKTQRTLEQNLQVVDQNIEQFIVMNGSHDFLLNLSQL